MKLDPQGFKAAGVFLGVAIESSQKLTTNPKQIHGSRKWQGQQAPQKNRRRGAQGHEIHLFHEPKRSEFCEWQRERQSKAGVRGHGRICPLTSISSDSKDMAVGQHQWYHFGVGEFTTHFRTYFCGNWDVHWGYGGLTHGHIFGQGC